MPLVRRTFITALGSAALWPRVTHAQQQTDKVWRVGYLSASSATNVSVALLDDFRLKLKDLGYVEGRNLSLYVRRANDDLAQLPSLASELVSLAPNVIVGSTDTATWALQRGDVVDPDCDGGKYRSNRQRVRKIACKARRQHHGALPTISQLNC